jgi:hypothetical protein
MSDTNAARGGQANGQGMTPPAQAANSSPAPLEQSLSFLARAPIALAILGICYDVGYFTRIGLDLFPLFSLSEHLVFAMEGVPYLIGLLVPTIIAMAVAYTAVTIKRPTPETHRKGSWVFVGFFLAAGVTTIVLYPGPGAWLWGSSLVYMGLLAALTEFADIAGGRPLSLIVMNAGILVLVVLLAFGLGYVTAKPEEAWPWSVGPATISLTDGPPITGRVLRSGERGLLIFNAQGTIELRRWDKIRGVEFSGGRLSR